MIGDNKKDSDKRFLEIKDRLFLKLKALFDKGKDKETSSSERETALIRNGDRSYIDLNSGNGGQQYQLAARFTKVEFPSFDGTKVQSWLFKCD